MLCRTPVTYLGQRIARFQREHQREATLATETWFYQAFLVTLVQSYLIRMRAKRAAVLDGNEFFFLSSGHRQQHIRDPLDSVTLSQLRRGLFRARAASGDKSSVGPVSQHFNVHNPVGR